MKKLAVVLALFMLASSTALARQNDTLPLNDTFDSYANGKIVFEKTGWRTSMNPSNANYTIAFENGKIKIDMPANGGDSASITKEFNSAYSGKNLTLECDFMMVGNHLQTWYGPVMFTDSEGTQTLTRIENTSQGGTKIDGKVLADTSWSSNVQYKIKYVIDLTAKKFELYIDSGAGYVQKAATDGTTKFAYAGKDIKKISSVFLGSKTVGVAYYLDNFKVTTDYDYIYVSPDGSDENDGSYEHPLKTVEAAQAKVSALLTIENKNVYIRMKDGAYVFDSTYTFGDLNKNANYNSVAFTPDNGANITVSGDYKVDIPELKNFTNETLKQSFIEDIKENYIASYESYPLEIGEVTFDRDSDKNAVSSVTFASRAGKTTSRAAVVSCLYKDGRLIGMDIQNATVAPGESKKVTTTIETKNHDTDGCEFKTFVWENMTTLIPLLNVSYAGGGEANIAKVQTELITDLTTQVIGEKTHIDGKTAANSLVCVYMRTESGALVYVDQTTSNASGEFEFTVNPMYVPWGDSTIYVSSTNGGAE